MPDNTGVGSRFSSAEDESRRTPVLVVGGGGHAKVVLDLLALLGWPIAGVVDDNPVRARERLPDVPVLGDSSRLPSLLATTREAIVAIGDNRIRREKAARLRDLGFALATAVHPRAVVSPRASLGAGTVIMAGAVVNAGSHIGDCVIINTGATVDHDCVVEAGVHVSPGAHLAGGVRVGTLTHVGIGAVVIENVVIGAGTVVGAGAAVVADVPDDVLAVGVPARVVGRAGER